MDKSCKTCEQVKKCYAHDTEITNEMGRFCNTWKEAEIIKICSTCEYDATDCEKIIGSCIKYDQWRAKKAEYSCNSYIDATSRIERESKMDKIQMTKKEYWEFMDKTLETQNDEHDETIQRSFLNADRKGYIKKDIVEDKCHYKRIESNCPYPRVEWESECNFRLCIVQGFIVDGYNPTNILSLPTGKCMKCHKEITTVFKKDIVEEAEEMYKDWDDGLLSNTCDFIKKQHEAIQYLKERQK